MKFLNEINEQDVFEKTGVKPLKSVKKQSLASIVAKFNDEKQRIKLSDKNDLLQRIGDEVKLNANEFVPQYEPYSSDFKQSTLPVKSVPAGQIKPKDQNRLDGVKSTQIIPIKKAR